MLELNKIHNMDCLEGLKQLDDNSIDCVMTSPPYWSLRDYGSSVETIWDSLADSVGTKCEHKWTDEIPYAKRDDRTPEEKRSQGATVGNNINSENFAKGNSGTFCIKCSAWKGQLGLEPTFDLYIKHLIQIFDEIKRVLKKEGTCWVNIGDTYASGGGASRHKGYNDPKYPNGRTGEFEEPNTNPQKGATEKSLCQIPSRFAIEMTNRGWILRNKIIWNKPNCMPSSAEDRFTVDFEEIFFFVKSKKYYFEQQLEKAIWAEKDYRSKIEGGVLSGGKTATGEYATKRVAYSKKVKDSVEFFGEGSGNPGNGLYGSTLGEITPNMEMGLKNKRTVWRINTKGYSEAHFATYPEALVEPMIKAGCPKDEIGRA